MENVHNFQWLFHRICGPLNPNKAGLFEGSFSGGVNLTPLHISRRTYPILIKLYAIIKQSI